LKDEKRDSDKQAPQPLKQSDTIVINLSRTVVGILVVVIAASFLFGYIYFNMMRSSQPIAQASATTTTQTSGNTQTTASAQFELPSYETPLGSPNATVVMVEFGDYQCPYCESYFSQIEPQVNQNYVSTGKVKFFFLDYAFLGSDSNTLAEGSWCANDQGKYWDYHDYVYSHQGQENSGWASPDKVKAMASNIPGIDAQSFSSCLDSGKYGNRVTQNTATGQSMGVTGTPGFLIGNDKIGYVLIDGAYPYATFQQALDSALQKA